MFILNLAMMGLGLGLAIQKDFSGSEEPPPPANGYVAENGTTFYVAEDGFTFYVQET